LERAIGAAQLNPEAYEEIEHDPQAMGQAVIVIVVAALAAGIGQLGLGLVAVLVNAVGSLIAWVLWAALALFVGTRLLPGPKTEADFGQLFRTLGFAAGPGVFQILAILPIVGWILALAAVLWQIAAMVVAVRQALDYDSTGRAAAVVGIGFVAFFFVFLLMARLSAAVS
jgi:hypothetical protein